MEAQTGRWAKILNLSDMRLAARRALPRAIFDYIDGAAEDEVSRRRNRTQFEDWGFVHRVGVDVGTVDLSTQLFGETYAAPFGIGPTGLAGLAWPRAEALLAAAAHDAGLPATLSTVSSVSIEDVARAAGSGLWFQLYIFRDRGLSRALLDRAKASGYRVLVITVDCAVGGNRERDPRNHFTLPLKPSVRGGIDVMRHPGWLYRLAANGAPRPENMVEAAEAAAKDAQGLVAFMNSQLDPTVTWREVEDFAKLWDGPVVVKGVLSPEDAGRSREAGADGVVISNHGGRQLDGAVSPLHILPEIRDRFGDDLTLLCDSGFRRGADIVKSLALGADGVLMGRNTLYGAAAGGRRGIDHVIGILRAEVERCLMLLGVPRVRDLDDRAVRDLRAVSNAMGEVR